MVDIQLIEMKFHPKFNIGTCLYAKPPMKRNTSICFIKSFKTFYSNSSTPSFRLPSTSGFGTKLTPPYNRSKIPRLDHSLLSRSTNLFLPLILLTSSHTLEPDQSIRQRLGANAIKIHLQPPDSNPSAACASSRAILDADWQFRALASSRISRYTLFTQREWDTQTRFSAPPVQFDHPGGSRNRLSRKHR